MTRVGRHTRATAARAVPPVASRLPALDGVRTFAVLAVVLYHVGGLASPNLARFTRGGQAGVDVFFVLSGFVVTRLLLREQDRNGRIRVGAFLLRRVERLMPALIAMLAVVTSIIAFTAKFRHEMKYALLALTYTMDFARAAAPPNNVVSALFSPTWTLGIEMQFYLVWPLILIAILSRRRVQVLAVTLLLAAASFAWGAILIAHSAVETNRVNCGPDTRAMQLLLGCAVAILLSLPASRWRAGLDRAAAVLMWPAAAVLVYWIVEVPAQLGPIEESVLRGLPRNMLVVGLAAAVLIYGIAVNPAGLLTRGLAWRPLSLPGARYSYALYLWHLPLIVLAIAYVQWTPVVSALLAVLVAAFAAYLSSRFVEAPFNRRRVRNQAAVDAAVRGTGS